MKNSCKIRLRLLAWILVFLFWWWFYGFLFLFFSIIVSFSFSVLFLHFSMPSYLCYYIFTRQRNSLNEFLCAKIFTSTIQIEEDRRERERNLSQRTFSVCCFFLLETYWPRRKKRSYKGLWKNTRTTNKTKQKQILMGKRFERHIML